MKAAIFNSINSIIGGGILGLPFAMLQAGLIVGLILQAISFLLGLHTTNLLLLCKNLWHKDTYSSIGFMSFGRFSILIVSGTITFLWIGLPISYMIIFADAAVPLTREIADNHIHPEFRAITVLILGVIICYFWIKREIHELRIISYASVTWAVLFTVTLGAIYVNNYSSLEHSLLDHLYPKSITGFFQTAPTVFLAYYIFFTTKLK